MRPLNKNGGSIIVLSLFIYYYVTLFFYQHDTYGTYDILIVTSHNVGIIGAIIHVMLAKTDMSLQLIMREVIVLL